MSNVVAVSIRRYYLTSSLFWRTVVWLACLFDAYPQARSTQMDRLKKSHTLLIAENNPDDVFLIKGAMEGAIAGDDMHVVDDGEAALRFLYQQEPFDWAPRPNLMILDLLLPKVPGMEVLRQIKKDRILRSIPVIVFSHVADGKDVVEAYDLLATSYVQKPATARAFSAAVERIRAFWLETARLPR